MAFWVIKIIAAVLLLSAPGMVTSGWALNYMYGNAELSYVKYDAETEGREIFSGSSLVKRFSLGYVASNLYTRSQPTYYNLSVGYNWVDFNTKGSDLDQEFNIKQSFGRFSLLGDVGYDPASLPISIKAFRSDHIPITTSTGLSQNSLAGGNNLITDNLMYSISGRGKSIATGVSFVFEPTKSGSLAIRALPRMLLDYRESENKITEGLFMVDSRTRELAVAGLNKENNWVKYSTLNYENFLDSHDNYTQQKFQIGLVDNAGRRKWSTITNWIDISVDGQLTTIQGPIKDRYLETYDMNFMAIATRKTWTASTFMNYNRTLDSITLTETASVPVYVNGIYGKDTSWYVSLAAIRGRQQIIKDKGINTSATNSISAGGTTFNNSSFTLSPAISLQTSKSNEGIDSYAIVSSLATASTGRFSDKASINARISTRAMDDGYNSPQSKSWSNTIEFQGLYAKDTKYSYVLQDTIDSGSGTGYLETNRLSFGGTKNDKIGNYLRNSIRVAARWLPSARFTSSLEVSYDIIKATDLPANSQTTVIYSANYGNQTTSYKFDSKYESRDNGIDSPGYTWKNYAEVSYRPDRYNEGFLRLSHSTVRSFSTNSTNLDLLQRYTYNIFARSGVIRNLATLVEEYSLISGEVGNKNGNSTHTQYLQVSGRYNPTERFSLFGSGKYEKTSPGSVTMYYSTGMSADFRLLSASIDYTFAKRDLDHRLEKRLSASVRRSF